MQEIRHFFIFGNKLLCSKGVYFPSDDSWLLQNILKKEISQYNGLALDIGCGSGIQTITLAKKNFRVFASDIQKIALLNTKINAKLSNVRISCIWSDVWKNIPKKKFEIICFNPPYVPSSAESLLKDINVDGGIKGREILDKFLIKLNNFLHKNGRAYFVQTNLNGLEKTREILERQKISIEVVAKKRLFFEELYVVKAEFL